MKTSLALVIERQEEFTQILYLQRAADEIVIGYQGAAPSRNSVALCCRQ
jgi:hypothetical protein